MEPSPKAPLPLRDADVRPPLNFHSGRDIARVAPDDTVLHPLIGVTDVRFMGTQLDTDSTLDQRERATNPLYPQVLVLQWVDPSTQQKRIEVLVETVANRHPQHASLDGAGSGLHVEAVEGDTFRGFYRRWGIVATDTGYFCAQLISPR